MWRRRRVRVTLTCSFTRRGEAGAVSVLRCVHILELLTSCHLGYDLRAKCKMEILGHEILLLLSSSLLFSSRFLRRVQLECYLYAFCVSTGVGAPSALSVHSIIVVMLCGVLSTCDRGQRQSGAALGQAFG